MSYITQEQLEARFAGLRWWTDDAAAGAIDGDIVAEAIALAGGKIDQAAMQQYSVPLTLTNSSTAAAVREAAGAIAGYYLCSRVQDREVPANMAAMYKDAIDWLEKLANGKVYLAGESTAEVARPAGGIVIAGGEAVVTRESMGGL